jgi:hypothetical protein
MLATASALVAALPPDLPLDEALARLDTGALLRLLPQLGEIGRLVDATGARVAGELARQDEAHSAEPLCIRLGERTLAEVLARESGVPVAVAQQWCRLGEAVTEQMSILGERLPAKHAAVAAALDAGALTAEAGAIIVRLLSALEELADHEQRAGVERFLVGEAPRLTLRELGRLCVALRDRFDSDGIEPREEALRAKSGLRFWNAADGLVHVQGRMHPEAAGAILAAIDARTAPRRAVQFTDDNDHACDPATGDSRTLAQKRLDALHSISLESLAHDDGELAGVPVTMVVTCSYESLRDLTGGAQIFGVDTPISARTARRLAVNANILPIVLGGESEILDVGRARRLHSKAQRLAMAVRDGGCIWPACEAPPSWCEAAHSKTPWAAGGATSLDSGALFCGFHHRRFDLDGWELEVKQGVPYLVPPPWVDPTRTPRRGGRERLPDPFPVH